MSQYWTTADRATGQGGQIRPFIPPRLTINLSLAPEQRYDEAAAYMKQHLDLPKHFDSILDELTGPAAAAALRVPIRLLMRRLHSDEEDAEVGGISRATGVPRALLVLFNVFVDMIMGCTSGGARVTIPARHRGGGCSCCGGTHTVSWMFHFRTLDWAGASLRRIIIELDFVRFEGGPVVARTLTYFGYVGVLTGVRPGLSVSLNRRPRHDRSSLLRRVRYRGHQLLVAFGLRPGVPSVLRGLLFDDLPSTTAGDTSTEDAGSISYLCTPTNDDDSDEKQITKILRKLEAAPSTAAYLNLCTPTRIYNVEKDHRSARWTSSKNFVVTCNNDVTEDRKPGEPEPPAAGPLSIMDILRCIVCPNSSKGVERMRGVISGSVKRKQGILSVRDSMVARRRLKNARADGPRGSPLPCNCGERGDRNMTPEDLLVMVKHRPMSISQTQYAAIMDPLAGVFVWRMAYAARHKADGGERTR